MKKNQLTLLLLLLCLLNTHFSLYAGLLDNLMVKNVSRPVIVLNGKWKLTNMPKGEY